MNHVLSEFESLPRIQEGIHHYYQYVQSLFAQRRYLEIVRFHTAFSDTVKPDWFLSPVASFVPELELMVLESALLSKSSPPTERAITYIESVLSKSFIERIESHSSGVELLEGALTGSARTSLSRIAFLVSEISETDSLQYLLVAVNMHHANVEAWDRLLTGWGLSDASKFRLVRSVKWQADDRVVAEYCESLIKRDNEVLLTATDRFSLKIALRKALVSWQSAILVQLVNNIKSDENSLLANPELTSIALYLQGESSLLFCLASRLLKDHPENPDSFFVGGVYYLSVKRFDIARKLFSRARGTAHGWIGYGLAFAFSDESGHAINAFRAATFAYPKCVLPWLYAGMECIRTNELKLAQSLLISALSLCGQESVVNEEKFRPLVLNEIGLICLKAEQFDIAAENLQMCCQSTSKVQRRILSVFHSNLGHALIKIRDVDGALRAFETAISFNRQNGNALAGLGFCHHCKGNLSKAIDLYSASLYHVSSNRKTENLVNNLIQIAVNEYSFSIKQSAVVAPADEEAMVLSVF
jgi:tetratricopeptide (TPR) repeat protein